MGMQLNPYIGFKDNAAEALAFYAEVIGGTVESNTFAEFGDPSSADHGPGGDLIMHGVVRNDAGLVIMAADTPPGMDYLSGSSVSICVSGEDEPTLRGYWDKLSDGAKVTVALERQMWGDTFGMLTDKFGIDWMININTQPAVQSSSSASA